MCIPAEVANELLRRSRAYPVLHELVAVQSESLTRSREAFRVALERVEVLEVSSDSLRLTSADLRRVVASQRVVIDGQARQMALLEYRRQRSRWGRRLEGVAVGVGVVLLVSVATK